jgi:hypothetical protein
MEEGKGGERERRLEGGWNGTRNMVREDRENEAKRNERNKKEGEVNGDELRKTKAG